MHRWLQSPTRPKRRDRQAWCSLTWSIAAVIACALVVTSRAHARTFSCGAGDVDCLIDAINEANTNGQTNTIRLAAGTYLLTDLDNTTDGPNGLPSITSSLTITGAGANTTIIEREGGAPFFRLLHVAGTGSLTLDGVTLQGGFLAAFDLSPESFGGGIHNTGTLALTNSSLTGNGVGNGGGGGIYNTGTVTLTNSSLTGNAITGLRSGGGGGIHNTGTLTITNSSLAGNSSRESAGGIFNSHTGTVTLTNSSLTGNISFDGGGGGIANGGTLTLTNCTVADNYSDDNDGGGIINGGTLTLTNCTVADNTGWRAGGGISNRGTAILTNCTLTGNMAFGVGNGGGIFNTDTLRLTNCTLTDNSATAAGGGIFNTGTLTLTNSTLTGNVAEGDSFSGGGIANAAGSIALQNTILALNTAFYPSPHADDCVGVVTSLGTNLIGDRTGCTIVLQPSDLEGDPGLGDFTDNGRPGNGHVPLLPTSPAIDVGNDAACPRQDQLGQPRVDIRDVGSSRCDIGAIEFQHRDNQQRDEALATTQ